MSARTPNTSCQAWWWRNGGPRHLKDIESAVNTSLYQNIQVKCASGIQCQMYAAMQYEKVPKHSSRSTTEWLKKQLMKVLQRCSQTQAQTKYCDTMTYLQNLHSLRFFFRQTFFSFFSFEMAADTCKSTFVLFFLCVHLCLHFA